MRNSAPDICCAFQPPESRAMVEDIQERFSARFRYPKQLEDLGLDCVILAPSMLEPLPERMPAEDGRLLSLTCFYDSDCGCNARHWLFPTIWALCCVKCGRIWTPMRSRSCSPHVERLIDGYRFSYEAKDAGVESLYLSYTISGVPVFLQQPAGHT